MDQNSVFAFSEHFDGELLRKMSGDNIKNILAIFEKDYSVVSDLIKTTQTCMELADWMEAARNIHQLKSAFFNLRNKALSEELRKLEHRIFRAVFLSLPDDESAFSPEASDIIASFHRMQLEILAHLPIIHAEIDRMHVYLSHPQRGR